MQAICYTIHFIFNLILIFKKKAVVESRLCLQCTTHNNELQVAGHYHWAKCGRNFNCS